MKNHTTKDGKTLAIISYFTAIGLVVSFALNREKRNYFTLFHMRQSIGLHLLFFANRWIVYSYFGTAAGNIGSAGVLVLFVLGIIGAFQEEQKLVPLFGEKFQEWFRNI